MHTSPFNIRSTDKVTVTIYVTETEDVATCHVKHKLNCFIRLLF